MERHQCKLCSRIFNNGRALGGHMKAHMAVLPLPPKAHQLAPAESTHSASSSSSSSEDEQQKGHQQEEEDQKALVYGLRENPKKSFRLADPEFSFQVDAGSVVIQDRESETESRNPTRRRSKRNRRMSFTEKLELKKPKLTTSTVDSPPAEPEPLSSVSDTSPEEDVAMCLMMLSRDVWLRTNGEADQEQNGKEVVAVKDDDDGEFEQLEEIKLKKVRGKNRCDKCSKLFRSHQAMCVHRKICFRSEAEANNAASSASLFKCPFCSKIFGSGQALGGHKRSHLSGASGYSRSAARIKEVRESFIDLNMPAPQEEDDFSVVSDA